MHETKIARLAKDTVRHLVYRCVSATVPSSLRPVLHAYGLAPLGQRLTTTLKVRGSFTGLCRSSISLVYLTRLLTFRTGDVPIGKHI